MENRGGRRYRSKSERRQIVEETLKPGASVSLVARAHDVNTNQVFHWRRQYREGHFDQAEPAAALVPLKISGVANESVQPRNRTPKPAASTASTIVIDFGHARVRIETADAECVRAAVEGLLR